MDTKAENGAPPRAAPNSAKNALDRQLELEPGGGLHAHGLAELGDDGELARAHREDAQGGEPDQDRAESEESEQPDAARETDGGQPSTSG
ncbi:MAG: hypothetical protein HY217_01115 [Candidatus Rokubacteria bacterium]|nr:hypothetical protein [Candidatus Rokubacteria bacterium]